MKLEESGRFMVNGADVLVIGGGPAGLAAAIAARRRGFQVVVADGNRPPIDKPCGEGLMPDSIAALQQLGVEMEAGEGYPLRGLKFLEKEKSATACFPSGRGVGLRRPILHQKMLNRAAALGVQFLWETPVIGIRGDGVNLAGGNFIQAKWIIGADGGQSRVRRWAGLESSNKRDSRLAWRAHFALAPWSEYVEIHWAENAQAYVTPVSAKEVCVVMVSRSENRDIRIALKEFPELASRLSGERLSRPARGTITTMHRLKRVCRDNVALIGDASGSVDAITAEGLSLSFHQAVALAEAMEKNCLDLYQKAHRQFARRPTFMARLLLLLDGRARLRRRTLTVFRNNPEVFARLISIHVGETSPTHFATTGALLGWRFLAA
ncbi:MAG TPA: FAD-dependent monooxygenase [Methylomirabilota bacterium]|jgi:flavin-dependent dehydrogenase|nr:FAD-dependent monooxygenase [Methylomirabilota bacterium]